MDYQAEYIRCLDHYNLHYDVRNDGNSECVDLGYKLDTDNTEAHVLTFFREETVETFVFSRICIEDATKRDACLRLLNESNMEYKFGKFYINNDGFIVYEAVMPMLHRDFDSEKYMRVVRLLVSTYGDVYPKLRRLQWS